MAGIQSGFEVGIGVRMRTWGKWVSEIQQPRKKNRIWLGAFSTPEMATRAHNVAVLSIKGNSTILNFPKLARSLPRPASNSPQDVQATASKELRVDTKRAKRDSRVVEPRDEFRLWLRSASLSLLSYFLCCWCSGFVFVLLGVVGLGFEEGFALVFGLRFERELRWSRVWFLWITESV